MEEESNITLNSIKSPRNKKIFLIVIVFLIAIPLTIALVAQFQQNKSQVLGATEINDIVKKVGALVELPTGETPTVATVSDVTKLRGQEFFAKAQNGDKVLIYAKAQKAYLFRPGTNKIIEVAFYTPPVVTQPPAQAVQATAAPTSSPTPTQGISLKDMLKTSSEPTGVVTSPAPTTEFTPTPAR
jgi:hypothetical protein